MKTHPLNSPHMIALIDYGSGNVRSVFNALRFHGADVRLTSDLAEIESAEKVVLPGVGAFGDCVAGLRERGLWEPMQTWLASGRPTPIPSPAARGSA